MPEIIRILVTGDAKIGKTTIAKIIAEALQDQVADLRIVDRDGDFHREKQASVLADKVVMIDEIVTK